MYNYITYIYARTGGADGNTMYGDMWSFDLQQLRWCVCCVVIPCLQLLMLLLCVSLVLFALLCLRLSWPFVFCCCFLCDSLVRIALPPSIESPRQRDCLLSVSFCFHPGIVCIFCWRDLTFYFSSPICPLGKYSSKSPHSLLCVCGSPGTR